MAPVQVVGPEAGDDHHGLGPQPREQVVQEVPARLVRPMDVLKNHEQGSVAVSDRGRQQDADRVEKRQPPVDVSLPVGKHRPSRDWPTPISAPSAGSAARSSSVASCATTSAKGRYGNPPDPRSTHRPVTTRTSRSPTLASAHLAQVAGLADAGVASDEPCRRFVLAGACHRVHQPFDGRLASNRKECSPPPGLAPRRRWSQRPPTMWQGPGVDLPPCVLASRSACGQAPAGLPRPLDRPVARPSVPYGARLSSSVGLGEETLSAVRQLSFQTHDRDAHLDHPFVCLDDPHIRSETCRPTSDARLCLPRPATSGRPVDLRVRPLRYLRVGNTSAAAHAHCMRPPRSVLLLAVLAVLVVGCTSRDR